MKRLIALCSTLLVLGAATPVLAGPHSHDAHASPPQLAFDQGRKWATDEPLRRHMDAIRSAISAHGPRILAGRLSDEEARVLGVAIEGRVAGIVSDCRLPPAADENLHIIVADLVEASDVLQGRTKRRAQQGTAIAARATQMYATYFDHPGWKPVY